MNRFRALAWPSYIVAILFITFPVVDTILTIIPIRMGEVSWRFGAGGLFSRALLTPMLGIFLMITIAALFEHRRALQTFTGLSALATLMLLGTMVLFVLDAVQMRAQINPEIKNSFDIAALVALGKYAATAFALASLAVIGWKLTARERKSRTAAPVGEMLVGRSPRPAKRPAGPVIATPNSETRPL